ncbi:MAG: BUG/TctC family periplasmic protein, partial [uncultured Acetobacteraceae bacterium]
GPTDRPSFDCGCASRSAASAAQRRGNRAGPDHRLVAGAPRAVRDRVPAGRLIGHRGALARAQTRAEARPTGGRGEPAGRQRHHRLPARGRLAPRRAHDAPHHRRHAFGQPGRLPAPALPAAGLPAGRAGGAAGLRARRAQGPRRAGRGGLRPSGAPRAGPAHLLVLGRRQHVAGDDGDVPRRAGPRHAARPVPGLRLGRRRAAGGPGGRHDGAGRPRGRAGRAAADPRRRCRPALPGRAGGRHAGGAG